ncbi:MAG: response regulator [Proteobacteria bacterium]|nr:response regulator [Pseudomonadota bacterium]
MAELLEEIGCIVTEAEDGPEGLLALQNAQREGSPFHLLISDIGLPGLDGGRLVEAARALDARLPILLVTGYAGSAPGQAALPADVVILRKPFGLEELAAQASALLHEKAAVSP